MAPVLSLFVLSVALIGCSDAVTDGINDDETKERSIEEHVFALIESQGSNPVLLGMSTAGKRGGRLYTYRKRMQQLMAEADDAVSVVDNAVRRARNTGSDFGMAVASIDWSEVDEDALKETAEQMRAVYAELGFSEAYDRAKKYYEAMMLEHPEVVDFSRDDWLRYTRSAINAGAGISAATECESQCSDHAWSAFFELIGQDLIIAAGCSALSLGVGTALCLAGLVIWHVGSVWGIHNDWEDCVDACFQGDAPGLLNRDDLGHGVSYSDRRRAK